MKRTVLMIALALSGCGVVRPGGRELDVVAREYLAAAAVGDTFRLRAVSVGPQPLARAIAIRERRPDLLATPDRVDRQEWGFHGDTAFVQYRTGSSGGRVDMLLTRQAGQWKIARIQVPH